MKKYLFLFLVIAAMVVLVSCAGEPGSAGATGPAGADLSSGVSVMTFQDGVYPSSSYAGTSDNYLESGISTSFTNNGSGSTIYFGRWMTGSPFFIDEKERVLIKFDLSGDLPAGTEVVNAYLTIHQVSSGGTSSLNASCYNITASWSESQSSWVSRTAATIWTAQGGDYGSAAVSDAVSFNTSTGYKMFTLDKSAVQGWIESPSSNYGIMLVSDVEGTAADNWIRIDSAESTTNEYRPKLTIYYKLP